MKELMKTCSGCDPKTTRKVIFSLCYTFQHKISTCNVHRSNPVYRTVAVPGECSSSETLRNFPGNCSCSETPRNFPGECSCSETLRNFTVLDSALPYEEF